MPAAARVYPRALLYDVFPLIVLPVEALVIPMPASELSCVTLLTTDEAVVPDSEIPLAVDPLTRWPAAETLFESTVMWLDPLTRMPTALVLVTVKPLMVT